MLMEDLMYFEEQPTDSAHTNHLDCSVDTRVSAVHENSIRNSITDVSKVTLQDDHIDRLRSDSFSDEWQDFTTSGSDVPQGVQQYDNSGVLDNSKDNTISNASDISTVSNVDFVSLSKTVFRQCFSCGSHDHFLSHNEDLDCQDE